jgi:hypothetical protein
MAGYRQIHTKIWKDGWFLDLEPDDKLLFIYLFSNERANLAGLYELPLKVIAFETDLDKAHITKSLERFTKEEKAIYQDGWIWIPNLLRYNAKNITSPKIQAHLHDALSTIPQMPIKDRWIEYYNAMVDDGYRMDTLSIPDPQEQEQEQEFEQEQEQEHERAAANAGPPPPKPPPKRAKTKAKDPPPPAVASFRASLHRFPAKPLWPGIVEVVGDDPDDLERWEKTCTAWLAIRATNDSASQPGRRVTS